MPSQNDRWAIQARDQIHQISSHVVPAGPVGRHRRQVGQAVATKVRGQSPPGISQGGQQVAIGARIETVGVDEDQVDGAINIAPFQPRQTFRRKGMSHDRA